MTIGSIGHVGRDVVSGNITIDYGRGHLGSDRISAKETAPFKAAGDAVSDVPGTGTGNLRGRSGSGEGPPGGGSPRGGASLARRRYLKCEYPEGIPVGKSFSLLASIVLVGQASAGLKPFDVPPGGRDVLLVVHSPGLRLLGDQRQIVHVPPNDDSERVMFELCADAPGPRQVSITAWLGGSYLGELLVEITAERDQPAMPHRDVLAEITTEAAEGAVSLVVRYDPAQKPTASNFATTTTPARSRAN